LYSEGFVYKALGIATEAATCCDPKPASQTFVRDNHSVGHFFAKMSNSTERSGFCYMHKQLCEMADGLHGVDLVTMGTPCQPFTDFRIRNGNTARTKALRSTRSMTQVPKLLRERCPRAGIFEQVSTFAEPDENGNIPLNKFVKMLSEFFDSIRVFKLNANDWVDISRERLSLCIESRDICLWFRWDVGGWQDEVGHDIALVFRNHHYLSRAQYHLHYFHSAHSHVHTMRTHLYVSDNHARFIRDWVSVFF
jgi:hypothetical protein